jgi:hypothetical protein
MTRARMNRQTARDFQQVNRTFARTKTITAEIKRSPSDGSGVFVALVSTFDLEPDAMGDVVGRHAFDRTVNEARANHPDAEEVRGSNPLAPTSTTRRCPAQRVCMVNVLNAGKRLKRKGCAQRVLRRTFRPAIRTWRERR